MSSSRSERSSSPLAPAACASAAARPASSASATTTRRQRKRGPIALLLLAALLALPGCYYGHLAAGQTRLLLARRPLPEVLTDPTTPAETAHRLRLVAEATAFARTLGLAVDGQYTTYVAWPGDRVVTTVVATRPGEVEARGFWFPVVGTLPYKGFFDRGRAEREAAALRAEGLDTCLLPVSAYSTLGWFDDPLTSPMLLGDEGRVVETVFHELVHATVFVPSEPDFDEGLATFLGQEAAIRFASTRDPGGAAGVRARVAEDRAVAAVLQGFRDELVALYGATADPEARAAARGVLEDATRSALAALPLATRDPARLAEAVLLNDACQALVGTYQRDLPRYEARLAALGGELRALLDLARAAAAQEDPRAALLGPPAAAP